MSSSINPFGGGGLFGPLSDLLVPKAPKPEAIPTSPSVTPAPNAPDRNDPSTKQAADEAARKAVLDDEANRRRRSSTILTSPMGDLAEAPVQRKSLLGS